MKRTNVLIMLLALLLLLSGCSDADRVTVVDSYTLLLSDNSLVDPYTQRVGEMILKNESFVDENITNKTVTLFGKTYIFEYDETLKNRRWKNNRLDFISEDDETGAFYVAAFDSETGALMYYANSQAGKDRSFQSEVNEQSSEAEFLMYAKKLVSQHCSVKGCQVEITSEIFEYDEESSNYYPSKHVDGYVNNTEDCSDFYAVYHFTFYKTIDGIRRYDTNVIEINNTGEVHRLWFNMQDVLYDVFSNIDIDIEQAENLTKDALNRFISCDSAEITPSLIATNDGTLWLQLQVYVRFDDGAGGGVGGTNTYMIQVAATNAA